MVLYSLIQIHGHAAECPGRGDRAMEYYNSLCPYNQNDMIEIRESEPYSYVSLLWGRITQPLAVQDIRL